MKRAFITGITGQDLETHVKRGLARFVRSAGSLGKRACPLHPIEIS